MNFCNCQFFRARLRSHTYLVELLGSFLPQTSNEVAFQLVVKLAEGFNNRRIHFN